MKTKRNIKGNNKNKIFAPSRSQICKNDWPFTIIFITRVTISNFKIL